MNILFISSEQNPFIQPKEGGEQRTQLLMRACAKFAKVDVVAFTSEVVSNYTNCQVVYSGGKITANIHWSRWKKIKSIFAFWNARFLFPISKEKESIIMEVLENKEYDAIVIRYIPKAVECGLLKYANKLIIDVDDHPHDVFKSIARQASSRRARFYYHIQALQAKRITNTILNRVKHSFTPNFEQLHLKNASYLPNIPYEQTKGFVPIAFNIRNNRLFFIGALGYYANELGIDHFLKHIYPHIKLHITDLEFYIAGKYTNVELKTRWESIDGVKVLGFVEDTTELYANCKVVVVPIYHGAGTNIKVLEALQMNRACVVSDFSTRGFNNILEDGLDYLVAKDDEMFANYVIKLLKDENLNNKMASDGNKKIQKNYSIERFNTIVKEALINT